MKQLLFLFFVGFSVFGQKKPEDFGYKHLVFDYKKDAVDVIILSKKGDEKKKKPIFFWCQGSLPQPVLKYDEIGLYSTFPFDANDFLDEYHLVIIGKPATPLIADVKTLKSNYSVLDADGKVLKEYSDRNYLDYYVERNNFIISQLFKNALFSNKKLVVAGHSEGSTIAVNMAVKNKKITNLIYSGGNTAGRILSILEEDLNKNKNYSIIEYWKEVIANKNDLTYTGGDTYKATYQFSLPSKELLEKLKIPVLISYGTKDWCAPFNDLFYVETIKKDIRNITFIPYQDVEHNYFPVNEKLEPNYDIDNWKNVGKDWKKWLYKN